MRSLIRFIYYLFIVLFIVSCGGGEESTESDLNATVPSIDIDMERFTPNPTNTPQAIQTFQSTPTPTQTPQTTESPRGNDSDNQDALPNVVIFFTDDQGYRDIGVNQFGSEVITPNIDTIAQNGARFTQGYVTAPQCVPSRAGLYSGVYQQRFGVDDGRFTPLPLDVVTIGDRFKSLGYTTGMVGKWHLDIDQNSRDWFRETFPESEPNEFAFSDLSQETLTPYFANNRGYDDVYTGYIRSYWANFDFNGNSITPTYVENPIYRLTAISQAANSFIDRNWRDPFLLQVAHFAPHVPLASRQSDLNLFANVDQIRRQNALAMVKAIDDGVGQVIQKLEQYGILENTIIVFMSDNGAPLGNDLTDAPLSDNTEEWNGSLNTPLIGEKGMLSEGGIRVPFLMQWPEVIPGNTVVDAPVLSLDTVFTALKAAGLDEENLSSLDGVDLLPALTGNSDYLNQRPIFWRFWNQTAVRLGDWKYINAGTEREFLFDFSSEDPEEKNLIAEIPEQASEMKSLLSDWLTTLHRDFSMQSLNAKEREWYNFYFQED